MVALIYSRVQADVLTLGTKRPASELPLLQVSDPSSPSVVSEGVSLPFFFFFPTFTFLHSCHQPPITEALGQAD